MPNAALRAALGQKEPSTRYIYDRCNGSSVYRGESRRPCCYICFVPPPVIVFPNTCEQNGPCRIIGKTGCAGRESQKMRTGILTALLLCNLYALALTVFANLAASEDAGILELSSLAQGVVRFRTDDADVVTIETFMGMNEVAVRDTAGILFRRQEQQAEGVDSNVTDSSNIDDTRIYTWDDFCGNFTSSSTSAGSSLIEPFVDAAACQECADTSANLQTLFTFAALAMVMLVATNVTRRFHNYDVNCQKAWAMLLSMSALVCCFWAWYSYDRDCFGVLFSPDEGGVSSNNGQQQQGQPTTGAPLFWESGSALVCTFCASVLCFCMLLGHCLVPTPSICYEEDEQEAYEDRHRAIRAVQLPQVIPEVEDNEEDDGSIYYDAEKRSLHIQPVVRETVTF